jgi:hypothetical protein
LKGEVAKAIAAGNNAASTSDHESIVSRLKSEAAQAHAELLEAQALVQKSMFPILASSVQIFFFFFCKE